MKQQIWRLGSILFGLFCVVFCLVGIWLNGFASNVWYEMVLFCILAVAILVVTVLQNCGYTGKALSLGKYLFAILFALEYFAVQALLFISIRLSVAAVSGAIIVASVICLVLEWKLPQQSILPERPLRETAGQIAAVIYMLSYLYPTLFFGCVGLWLTAIGLATLMLVDFLLFLLQGLVRRFRILTFLKYGGNLATLLFGLCTWFFGLFQGSVDRIVVMGLSWLGMLLAVHIVCFILELKFPFNENKVALKQTPSAIPD